MCVGIKPEEWIVMYICVCGYEAVQGHTHIYMTTHSSGLVQGHTHIYMTTRYSGLVQVINIHVYMCVGIKPEEWVVMYICVCVGIEPEEWVVMYIYVCGYQARGVAYSLLWLGTGLIPTHTYSWLITPMAWYRVENHTHNYMTNHSSGLVHQARGVSSHVYMCVCGYRARGVSSHV
jgi:hypothetical protein